MRGETAATPILQTGHLTLRPLKPDDSDALYAIYRDGESMRFMPSLPHEDVATTRGQIERELASPGSVHWAVCLREAADAIGHVNYLGQTRVPGMGYIFHRDYWGRGFATEACRVALAYGFEQMRLDQVEFWIDDRNVRSQRVAHKLGFRPRGQISQLYAHETNYHSMVVYGLWADEWAGAVHQLTEARFFSVEPVLATHNVADSVAYYRDSLGFDVDFLYRDPPTHAGVSRGEWSGSMVTFQLSQVPPDRPLESPNYLYVLVDAEIDRLYETYAERGVEIVAVPETHPWGLREFTVCDLNGHMLRFGTHV